ncbi:MAG: hypothetical protein ABFR47_00535, partial [Verrucomicrobiota bacterium]
LLEAVARETHTFLDTSISNRLVTFEFKEQPPEPVGIDEEPAPSASEHVSDDKELISAAE